MPMRFEPFVCRILNGILWAGVGMYGLGCSSDAGSSSQQLGNSQQALRHGTMIYDSAAQLYELEERRGVLVPVDDAPADLIWLAEHTRIHVQETSSKWLRVPPQYFLPARFASRVSWDNSTLAYSTFIARGQSCIISTLDEKGRLTSIKRRTDDRYYSTNEHQQLLNYVWRGDAYTALEDFTYVSNQCIKPLGRGTRLTRPLSQEGAALLARISSADRARVPEMLKLPEELIPYSGEQGFPDLDLNAKDLEVLFQEVLDASGELPAYLLGSCAQPFDTMPLSDVTQAKEAAREWLEREVGGDLEEAMQAPSFFLSSAGEDFAMETVRRLTLLHHREILLLASEASATEWMLVPGTEELIPASRPAGWRDRAHSHTYRSVGQSAVVLLGLTGALEWDFAGGSQIVVDKPEDDVSTLYQSGGLVEHWLISPLSDTRCRFELPWGQGLGTFWTLWGRMQAPFPTAKGTTNLPL